jgi:hypothetical protein
MHEAPGPHAVHSLSSLAASGGCMALAPHLLMVVWLRMFWPHLPEKYDGTVNLTKFIQIYSTSIPVAGENEVIMANYFPVALIDTTDS